MDKPKYASDLFYRHREDAKFHAIVEMLVSIMLQQTIAPDEMRDAAFVASIKYMNLRPVRDLIYVDDTSFPFAAQSSANETTK